MCEITYPLERERGIGVCGFRLLASGKVGNDRQTPPMPMDATACRPWVTCGSGFSLYSQKSKVIYGSRALVLWAR